MQSNSPFKYVFIGLSAMVVLLVVSAFTLIVNPGICPSLGIKVGHGLAAHERPLFYGLMAFATVFLFGILATIAAVVYRDARKRGLDPWCWATVATFVPNLIGIVIYLIVRANVKKTCVNCGRGLQGDFVACPYCGRNQETLCPSCRTPVSPQWKVCPFCARPLAAEGEAPATPHGR